MIHVSSVSAIGIPENPLRPADEDFHFDLRGPGFNYHLSKKLAEDAMVEEVACGLTMPSSSSIPGRYSDHTDPLTAVLR